LDAAKLPQELVSIEEAVRKLKELSTTKFDQTVEVAVKLGIDARQADEMVRGAISLPHGIGKSLRVVAFCEGADAEAAKAAGAIEAGSDELVDRILKGWLEFDVAVAHPRLMGKVGKLGRVLGPQGKMPSPKSGTVTPDVAQAVKDYAAGKVEFRNDSGGNVHAPVGKLSFEPEKLADNIHAFVDYLIRHKPSGAKGTYMEKVCVTATMSPGIHVTF
jgi:large subunit ribosomal protein L1